MSQRGARLEERLAELQAELLQCFTQAADCREQIRELSDQAERHDQRAQWLRGRIERLQSDLVTIEIAVRGEQ